ncbi:MAG TPA: lysylphosphatidylglycerol synthase transmembrane domain-containing protein [Candidatus Competibacter sp.]|nr:lysylphosphatidylglycerol synthase transmembrane domain-containing protein [Candidatus Competibacter sp.]
MNTNSWIKKAVLGGKIAFTGSLLYLLAFQLDFQKVEELFKHISLVVLLVAIGLHLIAFLFGGLRWWLLLQNIEPQCNYYDIFPAYYLGLFSNNFLPTGFGGDAVRTAYLSIRGYPIKNLLASTIMDRALGLMVLLLTGLLTILLQKTFLIDRISILFIFGVTLIFFISGWILFSPIILNWLLKSQKTKHHNHLYEFMIDFLKIFHVYRQTPNLLLNATLLSLLSQAIVIGVYAMLGYSLGLSLPLIAYFIIVPLVMLATNIPISLGGLGLRESALVTLMYGAGVNYEQGVLLSFLYLLVLLGATLPGGLVMIKIRLPCTIFPYNISSSIKET